MAFQDRLNMNTRATVPQTPYTTERYEKEIALSSKASAEATDVNIKHRVEKVQSGNASGESRFFDKVVEENTPHPPQPLKFTSTDSSTIKFIQQMTWEGTWSIEYSFNGIEWASYSLGDEISISSGESVYFRGQKDNTAQSSFGYRQFVMTGSISASGDCTSLLNGVGGVLDLTPYGNYTFYRIFSGCNSLTTAPSLPPTTLSNDCYEEMFDSCTSLTSAPALPATTLTESCYSYMFYGCSGLTHPSPLIADVLAFGCYESMFRLCTSLSKSPTIFAPTLEGGCCMNMFYDCSSLVEISCDATDISASYCTMGWVQNVASSGDFYGKSAANWQRGTSGIPNNWTAHLD